MDAAGLLRLGFRELHEAAREELEDIDAEWLFWQPGPGLNTLGFLFWHLVRDEDEVVQRWVLRRTPLWQRDAWFERLRMDPKAQGTGFPPDAVAAFRYDLAAFLPYAELVWAETDAGLASLTGEGLDRLIAPGFLVATQLVTGCLGHAWLHMGEMRQVKGLRGWRFRE